MKECKSKCKGFKPVTLKSVYFTNEKYRDNLIQIALRCKETEISVFVNAYEDFNELFNRPSSSVKEFFQQATFRTNYCDRFGVLKLIDNVNDNVVRANHSFMSKK